MNGRAVLDLILGWITGVVIFCLSVIAIKYLRYILNDRHKRDATTSRVAGENGPRFINLGENGPELVAKCPNCGHCLTPTPTCLSCGHVVKEAS
jgi:hypothetical protein